jgi:single-stranded-DNA-specific exonuclease
VSLKLWHLQADPAPPTGDVATDFGVSPVVARLLFARGCKSAPAAARFLHPSLDDLHDPFGLPDLEAAATRIVAAIGKGEKICVYGDYDVDGVCAAALLTRALRTLGGSVDVCVPHRQQDGYDLQPETVARLHQAGVHLIITVDCGIVAHPAVEMARRMGIDVVVADHHLPGARLPAALAVVDPKRADSSYPFAELCGTALAYKLAEGVLRQLGVRSPAFRTAYLDMVALATVADCMPLVDENRSLVKHGIERLKVTRNPGLRALMGVSGIRAETLGARALGFALGPRINAVGRLDAAEHALQLLLTEDAAEAQALAEKLDRFNRDRQVEQERIYEEATRQAQGFMDDRILVLASPRWHPGVIGNVASRLVDVQARPVVMIAIDETAQTARGSARSIEGFHIFDALSACAELLERCGGHQVAAGFDMHPSRLEELRAALREIASRSLPEELLQPSVRVDAELRPDDVTVDLARELLMLEPFGQGNPRPVFLTRGLPVLRQARIASARKTGPDHLKLFAGGARRPFEAVFWRGWPRAEQAAVGSELDLCYELELNHYGGTSSVQLTLCDFRDAGQSLSPAGSRS